jgi:hypothetical protein
MNRSDPNANSSVSMKNSDPEAQAYFPVPPVMELVAPEQVPAIITWLTNGNSRLASKSKLTLAVKVQSAISSPTKIFVLWPVYVPIVTNLLIRVKVIDRESQCFSYGSLGWFDFIVRYLDLQRLAAVRTLVFYTHASQTLASFRFTSLEGTVFARYTLGAAVVTIRPDAVGIDHSRRCEEKNCRKRSQFHCRKAFGDESKKRRSTGCAVQTRRVCVL